MKSAILLAALALSGCASTNSDYLHPPLKKATVTQSFGENKNSDLYGEQGHWGLDLSAKLGARVRAADDGIVKAVGKMYCPNFEMPECNNGYGNWIMLHHEKRDFDTLYLHLAWKPHFKEGEFVRRRQTIGKEGGTGGQFNIKTMKARKGHHLHFAVGKFNPYKPKWTIVNDFQIIEVYDPQKFLEK